MTGLDTVTLNIAFEHAQYLETIFWSCIMSTITDTFQQAYCILYLVNSVNISSIKVIHK